jgi:hypothetical protein
VQQLQQLQQKAYGQAQEIGSVPAGSTFPGHALGDRIVCGVALYPTKVLHNVSNCRIREAAIQRLDIRLT